MRIRSLLPVIALAATWLCGCVAADDSPSGFLSRPKDTDPAISDRPSSTTSTPDMTGSTGGSAAVMTPDGGDTPEPMGIDVNAVGMSSGCGKPLAADHAIGAPGTRDGYQEYHVQQTGENLVNVDPNDAVDRLFWVRVPADYDPNKPYRVVYIGQGCGGGNGRDNVYPLFNEAQGGTEQAIYVAVALPPNLPNGPCYDNNAGEESMEWEAFELFHTLVESTYCVDTNRVFVSGYSTGGWLANMWGCYFAQVKPDRHFAPNFSVRGQLSTTGGLPAVPTCGGPVAGFWLHDQLDNANPIQGNLDARDRVLTINGCMGSATEPWGEGDLSMICERYVDCPPEYPVVFCMTSDQGHADQVSTAIPAYTQFMDLMNPM